MGASERRKGATAEREVAAILAERLGVPVKRKLGQARDSGDDIQIGRIRMEIKRRERLAVDEWAHQVEKCCGPRDIPAVIYRRSGEPWRVVMLLDDWIPLIREEVSGHDD